MNKLVVINQDGQPVVDSRSVAEAIGKQHAHLMRDIHNYVEIIEKSTESNFGLSDFFIPHTYTDSTGRTLPCYLLTKKGCDMVANKMTGEKGVLFTAAYVTAFEEMRETLTAPKPMSPNEMFLLQAQVNMENERQIRELKDRVESTGRAVQAAFETLALPAVSKDQWQDEMNRAVRQLCERYGLNYQKTIGDMYKELEESAGVNLSTRQKRLQERMKRGGAKYAECRSVSKLLVISQDKKLREIYSGIVRRHSAQLAALEGIGN